MKDLPTLDESLKKEIANLTLHIKDDLLSGAAEIALRAISVFQTVLALESIKDYQMAKAALVETSRDLIDVQPAMAPLFHLGNSVLNAIESAKSMDEVKEATNNALTKFESMLCASAATIADLAYDLIDPGELIFAYSFVESVAVKNRA